MLDSARHAESTLQYDATAKHCMTVTMRHAYSMTAQQCSAGPLSGNTVHNNHLLEAQLTLAGPAHHHIVVEGLGEAALDLKVVDLDAHSLPSHAVPWPGRAGCLCQCLQGDTHYEMLHMLTKL